MRELRSSFSSPAALALCLAITISAAGCKTMLGDEKARDPIRTAPDSQASIAIKATEHGLQLYGVDKDGNPTRSRCVIPNKGQPRPANACDKFGDDGSVGVISVESIAIMRHRGSQCFLIGPFWNAGRLEYDQICP